MSYGGSPTPHGSHGIDCCFCGGLLSPQALFCPHCGQPTGRQARRSGWSRKTQTKIISAFAIFSLLFVTVAIVMALHQDARWADDEVIRGNDRLLEGLLAFFWLLTIVAIPLMWRFSVEHDKRDGRD